ncbi:hypothetical protein HMPREF1988_02010 [Porphyromonas gingivalis F0185]|nr:hypothetical protein HMPREF1988_02010 [Porphyromonas gingivalis F0185]
MPAYCAEFPFGCNVSGHKDKLSLRKRLFKAALNIDYLKKLLKN